MTDQELLEMDPMLLSNDQLAKWEVLQKKAFRINKTYSFQIKAKLEQEEIDARTFKARRDIKVYNLENMKATIEMEEIHDKYQEALKTASEKMKKAQEAGFEKRETEAKEESMPPGLEEALSKLTSTSPKTEQEVKDLIVKLDKNTKEDTDKDTVPTKDSN